MVMRLESGSFLVILKSYTLWKYKDMVGNDFSLFFLL